MACPDLPDTPPARVHALHDGQTLWNSQGEAERGKGNGPAGRRWRSRRGRRDGTGGPAATHARTHARARARARTHTV